MIIFLKPGVRRRITVSLALILMLLGVRWGLTWDAHSQPAAKMSPLSQFQTSRPEIGFMVDLVSPSQEHVTGLLEVFGHCGIQATWFVTATWAEANPGAITDISGHGHEIGLKGTDEKPLNRLSSEELEERLSRGMTAFQKMNVEIAPFFYPPQGKYSESLVEVSLQKGYQAVKPKTYLTKMRGKERASAENVIKDIKPGDTVLLSVDAKGVHPETKYILALSEVLRSHNLQGVGLAAMTRGIR